jgi:hypothetical protein
MLSSSRRLLVGQYCGWTRDGLWLWTWGLVEKKVRRVSGIFKFNNSYIVQDPREIYSFLYSLISSKFKQNRIRHFSLVRQRKFRNSNFI